MEIFTTVTETPLVFFLVVASMLLSASFLMWISDKNRTLGEIPKGQFKSLEGLRGLLAVSVFAGHCVISIGYMHIDQWESPKYVLYAWATKGAVALFFMITGLLFWNKVLDSGCDYRYHFKSRIKRIYPLYLLMAGIVLIAIAVESGFKLNLSTSQFSKQLLFWLLPGITGLDSMNGVAILFINAGVLWTLQYEWGFYFILPIIASLFKTRTWLMAAVYLAIFLGVYFLGLNNAVTHMKVALPLLLGCLSAQILRTSFWPTDCQVSRYQWIAVILLLSSVLFYFPGASTLNNTFILWPAFILIAGGVSLFGFLLIKPMIYLGRISFGVYLLHGIFIYLLRTLLVQSKFDQIQQDYVFIGSIVPLAFALTWFCTWAHFKVELPFMKTKSLRPDVPAMAV